MEEPEHVPEHIKRPRGPKRQSPNGEGKRRRKSFSWRTTLCVEPMNDNAQTMTEFYRFVAGEVSPINTTIHAMSEVRYQNDGEPGRRWVEIDVTVHSSCAGNQRTDLRKRMRTMYGLKRTRTEDGHPGWLHIRESQRNLKWNKVIGD